MLAILLFDHRLAFVVLSALILGAAVPLAIAWARLLPEEAPPFNIEKPEPASPEKISYGFDYVPRPHVLKRSRFSVVLLVSLSISFALQLPGIPRYIGLSGGFNSIPAEIPQDPQGWMEFSLASFFLAVPGMAIAHSFFRPNLLSIPLIVAGVLVLLLWLLSAPLHTAITAVS